MGRYIIDTCKLGEGNECCRYLAVDSGGFLCGKTDESLKSTIDEKCARGKQVAQGNNCEGRGRDTLNIPSDQESF